MYSVKDIEPEVSYVLRKQGYYSKEGYWVTNPLAEEDAIKEAGGLVITDDGVTVITNEFGNAHSYFDLPSNIGGDEGDICWQDNGILHRAGNKPAVLNFLDNEYWTAYFYVQGWLHNSNGPAIFSKHQSDYYLFGDQLSKRRFDTIVNRSTNENQLPLYASWLHAYNFIGDEELGLFLDSQGNWSSQVPLAWVLRSWGINHEKFLQVFGTGGNGYASTMFDAFRITSSYLDKLADPS